MASGVAPILHHAVVTKRPRDWADYALQGSSGGPINASYFDNLFHRYASVAPQSDTDGGDQVRLAVAFVPEAVDDVDALTVIHRIRTELRDAGGRPIDRADFLTFDRTILMQEHLGYTELLSVAREYLEREGVPTVGTTDAAAGASLTLSFLQSATLAAIVIEQPTLWLVHSDPRALVAANAARILDEVYSLLPSNLRYAEGVATFTNGPTAGVRTALVRAPVPRPEEDLRTIDLAHVLDENLSSMASSYVDSMRTLRGLGAHMLSRELGRYAEVRVFAQGPELVHKLAETSLPYRLIRSSAAKPDSAREVCMQGIRLLESVDGHEMNQSVQIAVFRTVLEKCEVAIPLKTVERFAHLVPVSELAEAAVRLGQVRDYLPIMYEEGRVADYLRSCIVYADSRGADMDEFFNVATDEFAHGRLDRTSVIGFGLASTRFALEIIERSPRNAATIIALWPVARRPDHPLYAFWAVTQQGQEPVIGESAIEQLAKVSPTAPNILLEIAARYGALHALSRAIWRWRAGLLARYGSEGGPLSARTQQVVQALREMSQMPDPESCAFIDLYFTADRIEAPFLARSSSIATPQWVSEYAQGLWQGLGDKADTVRAPILERIITALRRMGDSPLLELGARVYAIFRGIDDSPITSAVIQASSKDLLETRTAIAPGTVGSWLTVLRSEPLAPPSERDTLIELLLRTLAITVARNEEGPWILAQKIAEALRTSQRWSPRGCIEEYIRATGVSDAWKMWTFAQQVTESLGTTADEAQRSASTTQETRLQLALLTLTSFPSVSEAYAAILVQNLRQRLMGYAVLLASAEEAASRFAVSDLGDLAYVADQVRDSIYLLLNLAR